MSRHRASGDGARFGLAAVRGIPRVVTAALLANAAVLLLGLVLWPLHQAPDEPWHVDLVVAVADGQAVPWPDPGTLGQAKGAYAGMTPVHVAPNDPRNYCGCRTYEAADAPDPWPSWASAGGAEQVPYRNWLVQHPPLYYGLLAVPLTLLPDWQERPYDQVVDWLRGWNLLLLLPLPLLAWAAGARLVSAEAGSVAAVLVLAVPLLHHIGSSVNNDNLLILLAAAVTVLLAHVVRGDRSVRTAVLVALLTGAALLTKGTALALLPAVAAAYVLARAWTGVLAVGGALALGGWWWVRNRLEFGVVQPNGFLTDQTRTARRPVVTSFADSGTAFLSASARRMSETFWLNTSVRTLPGWVVATSAVLSVLALALLVAGLVLWVRRGHGAAAAAWTLLPAAGIAAIIAAGGWSYWLRTERTAGLQGRYLYPALVALAVPVALGLVGLLRRWALPAAAAAAVALQLAYAVAVVREFWLPRTGGLRLADAWRNAVAWSPLPGWAYGLVLLAAAGALAALLGTALSAATRRPRTADARPAARSGSESGARR